MTKAQQAVLAGCRIKATLEEQEARNPSRVRVDWLRCTVSLDAIVAACPSIPLDLDALALMDQSGRDVAREARTVEDHGPSTPAAVCRVAASWLCEKLGLFEVGLTESRGMDYYTARTAIVFAGETVGWVLAGGRSWAQASTVHFNLFGSACLRIGPDRLQILRDWLQLHCGVITRVDLALDIWTGCDIAEIPALYLGGAFDVRGKRPTQREIGSWTLGHSRTFEVGSRGTGKLFRAYEKGDELFGHEAADPWVRFEVEIRNNHRVIDLDVLTRPADFFAGSYPHCAVTLEDLRVDAEASVIRTQSQLADVNAEAAVTRVARWIKRTAAPALSAMLTYGGDLLEAIFDQEAHRKPRRLDGFTENEICSAFQRITAAFAPPAVPLNLGAAR